MQTIRLGNKLTLANGATYVLWEQAGTGILIAAGTTVPSDTVRGFATGCLFLQTDGGVGTALYINEGTFASADFNTYNLTGTDLSTLAATAAEINRTCDVSTRIVNCTAATLAVTELAHDGKIITLNRAAGIAVTLPVASAGLHFRFIVGTTFTGAATIKSVAGADIMIGHATMGNDTNNSTVDFQALASDTFDTIDMLGTGNSTGGIAGEEIEIIGLATNLWFVRIQGDAAGSEATPFQDTVA